jgi:hypothetical protein
MSLDLKRIGVVSRPLFTKAEKRQILIEAATIYFIVAVIIAYFSLLAMCINTPEPIFDQTGEGVTVCKP